MNGFQDFQRCNHVYGIHAFTEESFSAKTNILSRAVLALVN